MSAGAYVDRQGNNVMNVGGMYAGARYDLGARVAIRDRNRVTPSLYGGAEDDEVWPIAPHSLVFTTTEDGAESTTALAVLDTLNGHGTEASVLYRESPHAAVMVQQATKNRIQYIGVAEKGCGASEGDANRGLNVVMGGLMTLAMGHGEGDNFIVPGDLVCAEVPLPGRVYTFARGDSIRSRVHAGESPRKTKLQLRRCTSTSAGGALRTHILQILENPSRWQAAMGERLLGTAVWATASHETMNSYLVGGLMLVNQLLRDRALQPTPLWAGLTNVAGAWDADDANALNAANVQAEADVLTALIAEVLGVVGEPTARPALARPLDSRRPFEHRLLLTRMNTLQRIFYDGSNTAFEIGHHVVGARHEYAGRTRDNKEVDMNSAVGRLLDVQLNHFRRGVSGMHAAILQDLRFIVGKATTGGSFDATGKVHVALNIARP
jgi:hypothetical protein